MDIQSYFKIEIYGDSNNDTFVETEVLALARNADNFYVVPLKREYDEEFTFVKVWQIICWDWFGFILLYIS